MNLILRRTLMIVLVVFVVAIASVGESALVQPAQAQTDTQKDYDADHDGLIEIANLAQLNAVRYDLDGDGSPTNSTAYDAAFPNAATGMGCPQTGCAGYELTTNLEFDTNGDGRTDIVGDDYWNDGAGWMPIGGDFAAVFEGNSHSLSHLFISRASERNVGLFASVRDGAEIRDVGLSAVTVTGGRNTGGLLGDNDGTVIASHATGSVNGGRNTGGLVGSNSGTIIACYSTGSVSGGRNVGGLAGNNWAGGSVIASYATASAVGSGPSGGTGGLVGQNWSSTIIASYASGFVRSSGSSRSSGGLVGDNWTSRSVIASSYATGSVTTSGSSSEGGGLVGSNGGTINASYSTGSVTASGSSSRGGGLAGRNRGTITASYWDTQASGLSTSAGGVGKTTSQLQSPTGYSGIYADWNLDVNGDEITDAWNFGSSSSYPSLTFQVSRIPDLDFDTLDAAGNTNPGGMWSNGETMWVTDVTDDKIYAYALATGARDAAKDFDTLIAAGNRQPRGLWSNGSTIWVADADLEKVFAYDPTNKARVVSEEFATPDAGWPVGLWSDGKTIWVADWEGGDTFAYDLTTKARVASGDIGTSSAFGNRGPTGIWSDGGLMWVADWMRDSIHAYDMRTGSRLIADRAVGIDQPIGIWSNGSTMWVAGWNVGDLFAYAIPGPCSPSQKWLRAVANGEVDADCLTDRGILKRLYGETAGTDWENSANWLSDEPLGEWYGVTADADGRVTQLNLSGNGLSGEIPPALSGLSNLIGLDLGANADLSGPLPGSLGGLNSLTSLSVDGTRLCAPTDETFQEWLTGISDKQGVVNCPTEPPPAPTNLTAKANFDGSVTLTWDAPDDDSVFGYQILRSHPNQGVHALTVYVDDTRSRSTTFKDTDVAPAAQHAYRVKAINHAGLSEWSNSVIIMSQRG